MNYFGSFEHESFYSRQMPSRKLPLISGIPMHMRQTVKHSMEGKASQSPNNIPLDLSLSSITQLSTSNLDVTGQEF